MIVEKIITLIKKNQFPSKHVVWEYSRFKKSRVSVTFMPPKAATWELTNL